MPQLNLDLLKKLNLAELDTVEAVRRQGQAYALNGDGKLIAVSMTKQEIDHLTIGAECTDLEHLYLAYNNQLRELHFAVEQPNLLHLYANNCVLTNIQLPSNLATLRQLYVQENQLSELVFSEDCPALELLDASNNGLLYLELPSGFLNLKYVYLLGNDIRFLPESFVGMRHLDILLLAGNLPLNIPLEVIGSGETHNSAQDVLAYLSSVQGKNTRYLHEAKMILVGNPMVGKSSIRLKLKDRNAPLPAEQDRTPGLDVEPYLLKTLPATLTQLDHPIDFQLNIWDFGGQGRYREIQQLFCSRKSLYLYVTSYDDQPNNEDYVGLDYWMSMVNAYSFDQEAAASSPVIYVLNKIDKKDEGIDEKSNRERYQNLIQFAKISCEDYLGFELLIRYLQDTLPLVSRDIFTNRYSPDWFRVKERLANFSVQHLLYGDYLGICQEEGLDLEQAKTWLTVLDRIGSVIYTGNFSDPTEWIILNPNWVKDAICKVIDNKLMQHDGILREAYFNFIWADYPDPADRANLVNLMLNDKYKLAYAIPSTEGGTDYMVPSALFNKPQPSLAKYPHLEQTPDYRFQFRFEPFIPAGILNKLMVTLNAHIYNNLIWGNGVVLHDGLTNTFALLQENWQEKRIEMSVYGKQAQGFYQTLIDTLQKITTELKDAKFLQHLDFSIWMDFEGEFEEVSKLKKFGKFPWKSDQGSSDFLNKAPQQNMKKIFFSYSKEDKEYLKQLCTHLAGLRRNKKIVHWDDTQLRPGEEWDDAIKKELDTADIILLLVSSDFLNTEYIWEVEIKKAMERHERKEARVIPVFIRECVWTGMPFGKLNGLPSKAKPVSSYQSRDQAWVEVVRGIESIL